MVILTDGKTKWELNEDEFEEFKMRFEENELISIPKNGKLNYKIIDNN